MSEFTPGSWGIADIGRGRVLVSKVGPTPTRFEGMIASVDYGDYARGKSEGLANGRLIAAAPDLYAALAEAVRFLDYFTNRRTVFVGGGTPLSCLEQARAALAAADGRDAEAKP